MKNIVINKDNFDRRDLFEGINGPEIAEMFADCNSDEVAAIADRCKSVPLSQAVIEAVLSYISFDSDETAREFARFHCANDADAVTACIMHKRLASEYFQRELEDAASVCDEVANSKTFRTHGVRHKGTCQMLYRRFSGLYLPIVNRGYAFTRTPEETKQLYRKMVDNPRWAESKFGSWLDGLGKYQTMQFRKLFNWADDSTTRKKLCADLETAEERTHDDRMNVEYDDMRIFWSSKYVPTFKAGEPLPSVEAVENALLYFQMLMQCFGRTMMYSCDREELADFAFLYGNTDFGPRRIRSRLSASKALTDAVSKYTRPSHNFGPLDFSELDVIANDLGIDIDAAKEFIRRYHASDREAIRIPEAETSAVIAAMLEDADTAVNAVGPILSDAYCDNLKARTEAGKYLPAEAGLYAHWRPEANVMKYVILSHPNGDWRVNDPYEKDPWSVMDLSGKELDDVFCAALKRAYMHNISNFRICHFDGMYYMWIDDHFFEKKKKELHDLDVENEKRLSTITFPTNE